MDSITRNLSECEMKDALEAENESKSLNSSALSEADLNHLASLEQIVDSLIGEGKYEVTENGKPTRVYSTWHSMLQRCYDSKYHERYPTYKGCTVEDYLLNFQHICKWLEENYYEIPGERMHLDKDILCKRNKIYSRKTCIFVPQRINELFVKHDSARGKNPIGVSDLPSGNYQVNCNNGYGKYVYLGTYNTKEEAFQIYKEYKEKIIKEVIDSYEGIIPEPYYSKLKTAMYNYKVEIDD